MIIEKEKLHYFLKLHDPCSFGQTIWPSLPRGHQCVVKYKIIHISFARDTPLGWQLLKLIR